MQTRLVAIFAPIPSVFASLFAAARMEFSTVFPMVLSCSEMCLPSLFALLAAVLALILSALVPLFPVVFSTILPGKSRSGAGHAQQAQSQQGSHRKPIDCLTLHTCEFLSFV